jgi:hypothetical protein
VPSATLLVGALLAMFIVYLAVNQRLANYVAVVI